MAFFPQKTDRAEDVAQLSLSPAPHKPSVVVQQGEQEPKVIHCNIEKSRPATEDLDFREGSTVKKSGCSSRGPGSKALNPHSHSQLSVTADLRDLMTFSSLLGKQAHTWHTDIHASKTPIHIK